MRSDQSGVGCRVGPRGRARSPGSGLCRARLLGFARSDSGTSALEFALALPFLVTVLAGIIQFGAVFFLQSNMLNVARDTARRVSIGEMNETQAEASAQGELVNWGSTFQVQIVDPLTTADPNDTDVVVTITVPMADATIISFLDGLQTGDLSASVTMRSEGI